jgi:hypothetical protein
MPDRTQRLLLECQGFAGRLEATHETTLFWLAEMLQGHPRAQDFEPTGHGGSDPTAVNGTRTDSAALDGKEYVKAIERAWKALDTAAAISRRYQQGIKPERKQDDVQDVWCALHLLHDAYEPRYRNELCRPCAERKYQTGDFPSKDDVAHHIRKGRWPTTRVDPKTHIASVSRLTLGTGALTAEQAAEKLA